MKRIALALIIICLLALIAVLPVQGAPAARKHQHIAGVILKQGTGDAQVTIGVVDLGPSRKYPAKVFKRGVIIRDDMGRQIAIRGDAKLLYQGRTFQQFRLAGVDLLTRREMKRAKLIRVAHLTIGVFSGDDWAHWYDDGYVCASPQMSIQKCLEMWND